jgi:hypothetical protein
MHRTIPELIDEYLTDTDKRPLAKQMQTMIEANPEMILRFLEELLNRKVRESEQWRSRNVKKRILAFLPAMEEQQQIRFTYEVIRRFKEEVNIREIAERLCVDVDPNHLFRQIIKTAQELPLQVFNTLLLNELLLRGKRLSESKKKEAVAIVDSLDDYSWVGLELTSIETNLPLRNYTEHGSGMPILFGLQDEVTTLFHVSDYDGTAIHTNTDKDQNELIRTVANPYIYLAETGTYKRVEDPINPVHTGIICLLNYADSGHESVRLALKKITAKDTFQYIFNMAVMGGAYEQGTYGAQSRIDTWKVISGLVQKPWVQYSRDEVLTELEAYEWWEFTCDNDWLINEWLDLGIIGIQKTEKKYAALVISDTD